VVGTLGKWGKALRRGRGRRLALPIALVVVALGAGSPPAHAATKPIRPDRHGVIHACYGGEDGDELHLAEVGPCPSEELPLSWNLRGRRGPPGAEREPFARLLLELSLDGDEKDTHAAKGWLATLIEEAAPVAGNAFTLFGLGMLALALALSLLRWVTGYPWRWGPLRRWRWVRSLGKLFGPTLQIEAFEDGAMGARVGPSFALLAQARIDGGRETGSHLYLVTGEERTGDYIAALQGVPQTQVLALALSLLRLLWRRPRLTVSGSLKPIDADQTATVTVSLRLDARLIDTSEFWLSEPPTPTLTAAASNRVLAVAVAGWIEHKTIDETPGPPAREVLLSCDARSWALFRAGAELNRMSLLDEAADLYERALAIDHDNIGALIDLAHLRRLDDYYVGAETLALDALWLIERRNRIHGRRNDEDPNWYRAKIVLATTYADWARNSKARPAWSDAGEEAFMVAHEIAKAAMLAKDRLERLVSRETLTNATCTGKFGAWAYVKATLRTSRQAICQTVRSWRDGRRNRQSAPAARNNRAPPTVTRRWRTFRRKAAELHALLETTFEPAALLLLASNVPWSDGASGPPPRRSTRRRASRGDDSLATDREDVSRALKAGVSTPTHVEVLVNYVRDLQFKSPRVVYNLACWSGRQADRDKSRAERYINEAFELLRQSISRTPPLERRALLSYAELDRDLRQLRHTRGADVASLWRLVPNDEAPLRELDRFTSDATRWAKRRKRVRGLAVVGSWAQGEGRAESPVEVVLLTNAPGELMRSDEWLAHFGRPVVLRRWGTHSLHRLRVEMRSGLVIEFLITDVVNGDQADPGLRALAGEGCSVLYVDGDALDYLIALATEPAEATKPA
jgi:hypothetical protein